MPDGPLSPEDSIPYTLKQDREQDVPDSEVPEVGNDEFQLLFTHGRLAEAQLQEPDFWFRETPVSGPDQSFPDDGEGDFYTARGWRRYVNQKPPVKPSRLSMDEYQGLDDAERTAYDERRRTHFMHFGVLLTPDLQLNHDQLWDQFMLNFFHPDHGVKVNAVLDGDAGLGKTTIAKDFARKIEKHLISIATFNTPEDRDLFTPVVHVTLRALRTPRDLTEAICRYFDITSLGRQNVKQLLEVVCEAVHRRSVMLFVIHDVHLLDHQAKHNSEMVSYFKALMGLTGATFMYVGIDCERLDFFRNPVHRSQITSRFLYQRVRPYTSADVSWNRLIVTLESHLVLLKHEPGTLAGLDAYLFERTGGNIGNLMQLVRKAVLGAIGTTERLDKAVLDCT